MRSGLLFLAALFMGFSLQAQTSSINWIKRNGPVGGDVHEIEIDPVTSKIFMIGGSRKPYVSDDNGETWERITFQGSENNSIYDIEISDGTIFLLGGYALFASTDGGETFLERMTSVSPYENGYRIKRMPTSGNLVVLAGAAIYTSVNNGVTWTQQGGTLMGVDTRYDLEINAVDQIFILKNNDLFTKRPFRSTDGGATFTEVSAGIPVGQQVHNLTADNLGSKVYCITGAGMFSSTNGVSWASIKTGSVTDATISDYGFIGYIEFSADSLGMYFVDNLNHRLHSKTLGATNWVLQSNAFPSGTISATCATAKDYPGPTTATAFFGTPSGIYKTTTGGASVSEKNVGFANVDVEQILIDDNDYIYVKSYASGILKSQDGGNSWSRLSALSGNINHFFASPAGDALYALSGSVLYQSINNGTTWPALANVPAGGFVWAGATDNNKLFGLQYSCCSPNSFYYSSNKGVSWAAVAISGLPTPSVSFYESAFYFASQNRLLIYVYDYTLGVNAYYRIDFAYNATTQAITSAVATKITTEVGTNDIRTFQAANGKFYVYSRAASTYEVDVSSDGGLSWTVQAVPESREMFVTKNGYVFLTDGFQNGKVYLSRDDAATFQETTFSESNASSIKGVALDYEGYAYLGVTGDYLHVSQNPVVTPSPPTLLQNIGVSSTACALRWIDDNINDHYVVIERSLNGVDFVKAGQVNGNDACNSGGARGFFVDDNLQPNTNYTYRVKGLNAAGASAPSSTVSFTTLANSAQNIPDNRTWSAVNSGETGYGIVNPAKTVGVKHLGGGKYEVSDLSLSLTGSPERATFYQSSGQTFVGATRDLKPNGNSTWNGTNILKLKWRYCDADETETITLTLNATDPIPPAPGPIYAYVSTDANIEVSWQAKYYEKTYVVERSLNSSTGFSVIATLNYPTTRHPDAGPFVDGTTYFYRVKALNGNTVPQASTYSTVTSVRFQKPNFTVANNALTNFNSSPTLGSFWADFNNDGHDDYYTCKFNPTTESAQPVIFKNLGNSDFEIINPVLDDQLYFWNSIVDFDNDNIPDLALGTQETNVFDVYKGNGDFTFTKIPAGDLGDLGNTIDKPVTSPTWADINNDGLLDLLLLTSENGGIKLYKQNSNHSFTKIDGGDILVDVDNAFHAEWSDYDNDGFQDFLVTNIAGPARLYKNNGDETFTKITSSGIDAAQLYCAAWGDYNNDGNLDLFSAERTENALYKNNGNGTFTKDISTSISEEDSPIAASWGDYNNDGFLDLITTGFGTTQTRLFIRDATAPSSIVFTKIIGEQINSLSTSHYSVAHTDYDKNGLLDLSLSALIFDDANNDELTATNNNFYRNNNAVANWSEVNLSPVNGNKDGIGAKIILTAGGRTQARELTSASSLFSKNSMTAHFGLGSSTTITNIQVKWTDGTSQDFPNPPANQILNIVQDVSGPAITFTAPVSMAKAASLSLPITVTDQSAISSVIVFAAGISKEDFQPVNATPPATGSDWNASLSQTNFDDIGAEYYIEATDVYGNKTRHPQGTGNHLTYLIYSGEQAVIPAERLSFGGQVDDWRIIAVPFELGNNNTVDAVFDELSSLTEKKDYRIITYQNAENWADLSGFSTIQRGKGYFINIRDQKSINVGANLTVPGNSKSILFQIDLVAGWNMIGNPYLTPISWIDVAAANSLTGQAADLMKYTGSGYTKQTQGLAPYEGAFVYTEEAVPDVNIPLVLTGSGGRKKNTETLGTDIDEDAWAVNLNLMQGDFTYEMGSVGMAPDANPGHDEYDYVTPPRFFNYLEMNFDHPEHFAKRFTRDIVPTEQNYTWDLTVDSNLEGMAELNWDNGPLMGSGKDLFLLDISAQKLVNMKKTSSHRFDPKEASRFRVYYGNNLDIAPERVQLGKAYPNPTNGYTTIAFSLPETGGLNQSVALDIMDALGRKIGIVKQGHFNPGFHETAFDATEMINGFYTYRLTVKNHSGQTTEVNKLIIK